LEQVKYGNKRQDRMHMKGNRHMVWTLVKHFHQLSNGLLQGS